jgi:hypothetical protein
MAAPGEAGVVRGTQSFVGVMTQVWRRPSLTVREIAWRWLAGVPVLLTIAPPFVLGFLGMPHRFVGTGPDPYPNLAALQGLSIFVPAAAVRTIQGILGTSFWAAPYIESASFVAVCLFWNLAGAYGRTLVLRRLDKTLRARPITMLLLGVLRSLLLACAWWLWFTGLNYAAFSAITAPAARGEEPSVVLFCAMMICGTLFLYVAWAIFSWFLQLAPLLAMREDLGALASLRAALGSSRELRGKLIEINLVMNIVRIALLVLAMVFSATPLPFASVESQAFLQWWWVGVGLVYLAFSDYFHVVRAAAYLSLHRSLTQN